MSETKRIKTALVSVYHKEGLDEIITKLHEEGVEFLSTGGTRQFIESLGYPCKAVEDLTTYPSILGGRVKTLHPKIFGGILCRRGLEQDMQQIEKYEIPEIDLVIVDLYPFEATVASGAEEPAIIEKIDIGGISLIRAAAKNYNDVVIVASQAQYQPLRDMLMNQCQQVFGIGATRRESIPDFCLDFRCIDNIAYRYFLCRAFGHDSRKYLGNRQACRREYSFCECTAYGAALTAEMADRVPAACSCRLLAVYAGKACGHAFAVVWYGWLHFVYICVVGRRLSAYYIGGEVGQASGCTPE